MNRLIMIVLVFVFLPYGLSAQVAYMEEKAKVNKIKRSSQYLYGEGVAATVDEATRQAEQDLRNAILAEMEGNEELQDADKVLVNSIKKHSEKIQLKRGAMERVFLYVEKKNLFSAAHVVALDISAPASPGVGQPADGLQAGEEKISAPPVFNPVAKEKEDVMVPSSALESILAEKSVKNLEALMRSLKDEHKLMWGNVRSTVNPKWYVIVYSGDEVKAILGRETNGVRMDLLSNRSDALENYASDSKVWFVLYE